MPNEVQYVQAGDLRLCLSVSGTGPPLLFIGGTGWDLRSAKTPLCSPLTDAFTVALYDQRGQGRSDKPDGPYSMAGYAQDAMAVADALGWERPHVVGYSFGGMVAQEVAIRFPDRINHLVLAASTPGGAGGASYPVQNLLDLAPPERARRGLEIADLRFQALEREQPVLADELINRRVAAQTRFIAEPGALAGLRHQLAARATHDCFERLDRITAPTLVLAGRHDGQAPITAQQRMAEQIPNAKFRSIAGAHDFLFESDVGYNVIAGFLAED